MALITDQDLATFLGDPSLVGNSQAILVAALASGLITDYMDNPGVDVVTTHTDEVFDGPARGSIVFLLPSYPILDVTKVETLDCDATTWTEITDYSWNPAGFISRSRTADSRPTPASGAYSATTTLMSPQWYYLWPTRMQSIRVSYVSGYVEIPATVKAICLAVAARALANPRGLLSEQIGDYQYSSGAVHASWLELDSAELAALGKYKTWSIG
jgi:hypothetical protein